jgi:hypothetical protein
MHVRWRQQAGARGNSGGRPCLAASLINDAGVHGIRYETFLGSIEVRYLATRVTCTRDFHHGLFWKKTAQVLDGLPLEVEIRRGIEAEIARKVPRPTPEWALWGVTCIPRFD